MWDWQGWGKCPSADLCPWTSQGVRGLGVSWQVSRAPPLPLEGWVAASGVGASRTAWLWLWWCVLELRVPPASPGALCKHPSPWIKPWHLLGIPRRDSAIRRAFWTLAGCMAWTLLLWGWPLLDTSDGRSLKRDSFILGNDTKKQWWRSSDLEGT